jgi:hypothetical protein
MRKIVLLNVLLLISLIIKSQTVINSGIVSGTWEKAYSPFIVSGNILIQANTSLTIESGVLVVFNGTFSLSVEGQIHANGSKTDSIDFTSSLPDIKWRGIIFNSSDGTSSNLSFCKIENSGNKSGSGENTSFTNEFGGGLRISGQSSLAVSNCLIRRNNAYAGGGIYNENYNSKIINTRIEENEAWMGSAIHSKSNSTLKGCVVTGNISHIFGCLSSEFGTNLTIINNTITKNVQLDPFGGVFNIMGDLTLRNTIIYFNAPARSVYNASNCNVDIRYCNIEGGIESFKSEYPTNRLTYENNIEVRPYFADFKNNDFQLIVSTCVNHGDPSFSDWELSSDISGNPRKYSTSIVDIGAYEYQDVVTNFPPVAFPVEEKFILKNSSGKIAISYYDGDLTDSHTLEVTSGNTNLKPYVIDTVKNGFIVLIRPEKDWTGDEYVYIKLRDSRNEPNSLYFDSVLVHTGNRFKGLIKETEIFRDTVKIIGDVIVDTSGFLQINAGAYIEFQDYFKLTVYGRLNALGSEKSRITMNGLDTLAWYKNELRVENGWGGIEFRNTSDNIKMKYCNIYNTGIELRYDGVHSNGTVKISGSRNIYIENCHFRGNFSYREDENCGIYVDSSENIKINSCAFSDVYNYNSNGVYIYASNSKLKIDSCVFTRAYLNGQRAIIQYPKSELTITNSVFTDNYTHFLIFNEGGKKSFIEDNFLINNQSDGIFTNVSDTTIIRNNVIVGNKTAIETICYTVIVGNIIAYNTLICNCSNFVGVAINMHGAGGYIANNTIVSNYQDSDNGEAVYISYASPVVINNIFWKNKGSGIGWYNGYNGPQAGFPDPVIYNNYFLNPGFVLSDSIDYNLKEASACINKGVDTAKFILNYLPARDIYGNPRIDSIYKKIDIGAVEFQNFQDWNPPADTTNTNPSDTTIYVKYIPELDFRVYPNPASEYLILNDLGNVSSYKIVDYHGVCVLSGSIAENRIWVGSLNKGIYLLLLKRDRKYFIHKFIKN